MEPSSSNTVNYFRGDRFSRNSQPKRTSLPFLEISKMKYRFYWNHWFFKLICGKEEMMNLFAMNLKSLLSCLKYWKKVMKQSSPHPSQKYQVVNYHFLFFPSSCPNSFLLISIFCPTFDVTDFGFFGINALLSPSTSNNKTMTIGGC